MRPAQPTATIFPCLIEPPTDGRIQTTREMNLSAEHLPLLSGNLEIGEKEYLEYVALKQELCQQQPFPNVRLFSQSKEFRKYRGQRPPAMERKRVITVRRAPK